MVECSFTNLVVVVSNPVAVIMHCLFYCLCFPLRISSINVTKSALSYDLVTFTEEILDGNFLCSEIHFLAL